MAAYAETRKALGTADGLAKPGAELAGVGGVVVPLSLSGLNDVARGVKCDFSLFEDRIIADGKDGCVIGVGKP